MTQKKRDKKAAGAWGPGHYSIGLPKEGRKAKRWWWRRFWKDRRKKKGASHARKEMPALR